MTENRGFTSGFGSRFRHETNGGLTHEEVMRKSNWRSYHECKLCGKWFFMSSNQRYCIWCKRLKERHKKEPVQTGIKNFEGAHA